MKTYRAIIEPKPGIIADEYQVGMLRVDMTFSIGGHAPVTDPDTINRQFLISLRLHEFMEVTSLEEVKCPEAC